MTDVRGGRPPVAARPAARRSRWPSVAAMLLVGGLISLQSLINGRLAAEVGTGMRASALAAVISFGSGFTILCLLALLHRPTGRGVATMVRAVRAGRLPVPMLLGGLAGGVFVASQGIAAGTLGVALFIVCIIAGQSSMALVVDHRGWGPSGRQPVSIPRLFGAVMAVLGAVLSGLQVGLSSTTASLALVAAALLPVLAGAGTSVQQALNGRLAAQVGPWATTWNNFAVGTSGLVLFLLVTLTLPGDLTGLPEVWWLYLGGPIGIAFIALSTVMVRIYGVLVLGLWAIAGQVVAAVLIDLVVAPEELGPLSFVASGLTLLGVLGAMTLRARGVR